MTTFHHIGITCQDIEKSKEFYCKYLGFTFRNEASAPEALIKNVFAINSPAKIIYLVSENTLIELFSFPDDKQPSKMGSVSHIALTVSDREGLFEKLKTNGHKTIKYQKDDGGFILFVKDPDGILIELK